MKNFIIRQLATLQSKLNTTQKLVNHKPTYAPRTVRKSITQTRRDVADWQRAKQIAAAATNPKQYLLQDIYTLIADDAHLSSQINNRKEQTIAAGFQMQTKERKTDEKMTEIIGQLPFLQDLFGHILDSEYYGFSLVELSVENNETKTDLISRSNVVPDFGRFYPDTSYENYIEYRKASEYGKWLLEFNSDHLGILNKAVPNVLFKKFAQSCWSELCEIYGIPPRVMKTDTRDPQMLDNAEHMMRDIGAAAWFIIDTTEEFEFAQGISTKGEVYDNLIRLCKEEISLLINGAIIGQDTKNGNESKEKVSMEIADRLVQADKRMVETYMNKTVIPALYRIGWIPATTSLFKFTAAEDVDKLFDMTVKIMPHKKVSDQFIKDKFGIEVTGDRFEQTEQGKGDGLNFR